MSLIAELYNEIEIISQHEYNQLDEGAQRAFKRTVNDISQYYRCTSGPKKGKLASDPSKCGQRKDPAKVRHGRRVAKQKGSVRVRKTIARKRTQASKRVTKLNQVLKSRRAGGKRKMKKVGESFIDYLVNMVMLREGVEDDHADVIARFEKYKHKMSPKVINNFEDERAMFDAGYESGDDEQMYVALNGMKYWLRPLHLDD